MNKTLEDIKSEVHLMLQDLTHDELKDYFSYLIYDYDKLQQRKEITMNKEYKTFEELKEELGDKFEEYMYKSNIELLDKLNQLETNRDEAIEYIRNCCKMDSKLINLHFDYAQKEMSTDEVDDLLEILKGDNNE